MNPSAARVAAMYLRGADTNMGIDVRSWAKRRESWWSDLAKFIEEWWSFSKFSSRRVRGKMTATIELPGQQRNIVITVKGDPSKATVYVWSAEKTFGPTDSLETIMYWIDSITRP